MTITRTVLKGLILATFLSPAQGSEPKNEAVIVFHGLMRTSEHMQPIAEYLTHQGYHVFNLDYPSTKHPLDVLILQSKEQIQSLELNNYSSVHFVGYSMGGLIIRGILSQQKPDNLGRVVQLASPNHGSEVADFWEKNYLYRKFYGPAGQQLTTHFDLSPILGQVNYDLGVIAGNKTVDPLASLFLLPGENDGKVSVESTKLDGMKDHIVIPATHSFFPSNSIAHQQTLNFLERGKFAH